MSNSKLFIPDKIHTGYQKRKDTVDGKLSYVVYYGLKGELRKAKSFHSWIDKKLGEEDFNNDPVSDLVLNKSISRCNWSHFSSGRSMIRVYDGRGFEYEITPNNLLFILMHTDCNKRVLQGEFVYGWSNSDLVLVPTCSQEYKDSKSFTARKKTRIYVKDLIIGGTYQHQDGNDLIYLGKMDYFISEKNLYCKKYQYSSRYSINVIPNNYHGHIFYSVSDDDFYSFKDVSKISLCVSSDRVHNLAELLAKYSSSYYNEEPDHISTGKYKVPSDALYVTDFKIEDGFVNLTFYLRFSKEIETKYHVPYDNSLRKKVKITIKKNLSFKDYNSKEFKKAISEIYFLSSDLWHRMNNYYLYYGNKQFPRYYGEAMDEYPFEEIDEFPKTINKLVVVTKNNKKIEIT